MVQGDDLIEELRQRDYSRLICVGDRVSLDLTASDIDVDIAVVDGRIEREPLPDGELDRINAELALAADNPAGSITEEAWNTVREAVAHTCTTQLTVDGEEDLLALPAILFASPNSVIVHGHWEEGAVILEPDAALKQFVRDIIGAEPFPRLIAGGSWDRFHAGHRYFLLAAFEHGKHVAIGVTSDAMLAEKADDADSSDFEPFEERERHVERFLDQFGLTDRATITQIDDYQGTAVDADSGVLLVTEDTLENGKQVNQDRLEQGKTPLNLAMVQQITGADGAVISSTRIRKNEIDRDGMHV